MTSEASLSQDARRTFQAGLDAGDLVTARNAARALLGRNPQAHVATFVRRGLDKIPTDRLPLVPLRIALMSSFSIEFIHDVLAALSFLEGLRIQIYQAGFGQFRQEILNADSGLYAFAPDAAVLALEGRDLVPALYTYDAPEDAMDIEPVLADAGQELAALVRTFRERSPATLLVHNFAPPTWPRLGILEGQGQLSPGQSERVAALNATLSTVCRNASGVYAVDYAGLIHRAGALAWYDDRMTHYARAPIAQAALPLLAREYVKFLRALAGKSKKCLVLDLDNTLWGGILGEEGPRGIQLGPDYPGNAYVAFQQAIRGLRQRGVILALASKNNRADVEEVFATHPHMVLRPEDFSVVRVGWNAKSQSLAEIAAHLNIALDHVVFADDNPAECDEVSHALPAVTVLPLPPQPEHFVRALLEPGYFDGLSVSGEDLRRTELYQQRDQAEDLRAQSASLEDFYRRLEMEVIFTPVHDGSLARAAQLTQKTNQFNVTTIRYTEADLLKHQADPAWLVRTVQVRDRFGDNGIVGFMMAHQHADTLEIDTFLLSCRVIGRTVETAMLAHLCEHALQHGARRLIGRIVATPKNAPARDLFERHGFHRESGEDDSDTSWGLALAGGAIRYPEWMKVVSEVSPSQA
jgi:FkbH-like protein